jgi:mRNA-degrading endonuclease RelE of RelBE toxin-antitoxin system
MDKLDKFLKRLSESEREEIAYLVSRIVRNDLKNLDVKKLKGLEVYRVRKGSLRVLFRREGGDSKVIIIERRSERTYKNL